MKPQGDPISHHQMVKRPAMLCGGREWTVWTEAVHALGWSLLGTGKEAYHP